MPRRKKGTPGPSETRGPENCGDGGDALKRQKRGGNEKAVVEHEPSDEESMDGDKPPQLHPAGGGCMTMAGAIIKVWKTERDGTKLLDEATAEWKQSSKLREDFKTDEFLGVPGETWCMEIIKRVIVNQKCDFYKVQFVEVKDGMPTKFEYIGKKPPTKGKVSIDADTRLLIEGVVNPSYTDATSGRTVQLFTKEHQKDTPKQNRSNWQHIVGCVNMQFYERESWHSLKNLHLDENCKLDQVKGAFYEIEKIYHVIPKEGSLVDELKKQKAARAAKAAETKATRAAKRNVPVQQVSWRTEVEFAIGDRVVTEFMHEGVKTEFAGAVQGEKDDYGRYVVKFDDGDMQTVPGRLLVKEQ